MISRVQLKNMAIDLRRSGKSYSEILNEVPVSKGTLSIWLKGILLSEEHRAAIHKRVSDGRLRYRQRLIVSLKAKRVFKEGSISREAEVFFKNNISDPFFSAGILLYWAEGSRSGNYFSFTNSDPDMVALMVRWVRKYMPLEGESMRYRLYMKGMYSDISKYEDYWSGVLGIGREDMQKSVYSPTPEYVIRDKSYIGSMRITITRVDCLRKMLAWQKLLIQYYNQVG